MTRRSARRLLTGTAIALWVATAILAAVRGLDPVRAVVEGGAITVSVLIGVPAVYDLTRGRRVATAPVIYTSVSAIRDMDSATVEIPKLRMAADLPMAVGADVTPLPPAVAGGIYRLGRVSATTHRRR